MLHRLLVPLSPHRRVISIAGPIMLSLAGQTVVQMVDNAMVGQLGAAELAAVSLAGNIFNNFLVIGLGFAISLTPLVGQNFVAGRHRQMASFLQNSMGLNLLMSVLLCGVLMLIYPLLHRLGQPQEVLDLIGGYYFLVAISLIPLLQFQAFKQFYEGLGQTQIAMTITIGCNIVNIILNYLFIYGNFGCPRLGVTGAAVGTLVSRLLMPLSFLIYTYFKHPYRKYLLFFGKRNWNLLSAKKLVKIGAPISGQMGLECFSLSCIAIMMGWVGTIALAAYQVVMSFSSLAFMVANGYANASTVLTSHALARKNKRELQTHNKAALWQSGIVMGIFAIIYGLFGPQISRIFSQDPDVLRTSQYLFYVVTVYVIIDGLQVTTLGILRGLTDVNKPLLFALISYLLVCLPVAYFCGFVLDFGAVGVFSGFSFGLLLAYILLTRRYQWWLKRL